MQKRSQLDPRFSRFILSDFGTASGIALLGFRAHAFGQAEIPTVRRIFRYALGIDAEVVSAQLFSLARILGSGRRDGPTCRVSLAPPGCCRMTHHEVHIICALTAAQAQDLAAFDAHLIALLGESPPRTAMETAIGIGDAFAVNGLMLRAPEAERRIAGATTPAFAV